MAVTSFGVNSASTVKHWSKTLYIETRKDTEFLPLVGTGPKACIRRETRLAKEKGDRVRYNFLAQLTGDGVTENQVLEGNEESLDYATDDIVINELWHAVATRGEGTIDKQRVLYDCRRDARSELAAWLATRMSVAFHLHGAGYKGTSVTVEGTSFTVDGKWTGFNDVNAADANHIFRPNSVTTDEGLSTTDKFTLDLVDRVVTKAKTTNPRVKPFKVNGRNKYVMYLHPDQVLDLRRNTSDGEWMDFAKESPKRLESQIYMGALGEYNGVVFREAEHVSPGYNSTTFAEITTVRRSVLMGAGSFALAFTKDKDDMSPAYWREEKKDYGRTLGVAAGMIWGLKKVRFNSADYGTIVVPTYAAGP